MSAAEKGFYYRRLKDAGVEMDRHYREYTTDELKSAHALAVEHGVLQELSLEEHANLQEQIHKPKPRREDEEPLPQTDADQGPPPAPPARPAPPAPHRPPPQVRDEEVLRVDDQGRSWLQEEVRKPAYPKPRGRKVLRYNDPGVKTETSKVGEYTETYEVQGDPKNATPSEIKITMPSYQVGKYRTPRYPFLVVTYAGQEGFDRKEVEAYYGGAEMVHPMAKRIYVQNVLCYDIRSVIRAVNEEYRQLQLSGQLTGDTQ